MRLFSRLITAQLSPQELRRYRPGKPGQPRIVAVAIAQSEAVTRLLEEMPIQWLAISMKAGFQTILHGDAGHMIVAAKEDERRAFKIFDRVVRMTRA